MLYCIANAHRAKRLTCIKGVPLLCTANFQHQKLLIFISSTIKVENYFINAYSRDPIILPMLIKVPTANKMLYNLENNNPFPGQNSPDCMISHLEIKHFQGEHAPGPPPIPWLMPPNFILQPTALCGV